jgi:glucose-1-phosphate adenylyltransferase
MDFLTYGGDDEYVVMIDSAILSNIDLHKVFASHVASGKDVTVVTKDGIANGVKQLDLALKLNDKGEVEDIAVDYAAPADYVASMDIFVLSKKWLAKQVKEHIAHNQYHMDRDLILGGWQKGTVSVNVYPFEGVALYNESIEEYFTNSLSLMDKTVRHDLFGANHPVYTKVRDRVPTYYGEKCEVEDSLIADGCMIDGEVEDSVLFRNVTVCEGAEVEDCIIMNDTVVGEGSQLKCVILDKDVVVRPGSKLMGTKSNPIIVKRGEVV